MESEVFNFGSWGMCVWTLTRGHVVLFKRVQQLTWFDFSSLTQILQPSLRNVEMGLDATHTWIV